MKFLAWLSLTTLVSLIVAVPFPREEFTSELGKTGHFEVAPHEEKRAPCTNARDDYYCFLEAVYEDACEETPYDMRMKCAETCGFC